MKKLMVMTGVLLLVGLLVSVSCAPAFQGSEVAVEKGSPAPVPPSIPTPTPRLEPIPPVEEMSPSPPVIIRESLGSDAGQQWAIERMIVRTGDMWLVVNDIPVTLDQITELTDGFEGYVVSSGIWKEKERLVGSIAIRLPIEHFDDAIRTLREMAVDVTSESTSSKDVTEEYVDLTAKLQNLEATEEQLLRLMEKAETVDNILNVQRELSKTRGEIEQIKGRMQYLERTSATSLIEVNLAQAKLDVELYANKTRVKEGEEIQFTSQIVGGFAPYSYEWDFGDGNVSTGDSPIQTYKNDGNYTVSLTVTDDRGNTDTETRDKYIVVLSGWSAGGVVSGAWNGLVTFGHVLGNLFIWIGIFSPIWIVVGGIIYWRLRRRKKAQ